jgi:hypothetical protein
VPALAIRVAPFVARRWTVKVWYVDAAISIILTILALPAYFLPDGGKMPPLATILLVTFALYWAVLAEVGLEGHLEARRIKNRH